MSAPKVLGHESAADARSRSDRTGTRQALGVEHELPGAGYALPDPRNWPDFIERGGRRFRVAWCTSELEIRERLDATEADGSEGLILLTPLEPTSLGCDIAARLPRGRLGQSDRWEVLRGAFRVRDVDPRLRAQDGWRTS